MVSSVLEAEVGREAAEAASGGQLEQPQELLKRVPPSGRDFELFEEVVIDGFSTRGAASRFKISQTRVCQVVARVRQWVHEVVPAEDGKLTAGQQLRLAMGIAGDRLDSLYSKALTGWNSSDGEMEKTRIMPNGDVFTTKTFDYGDVRYLIAAGRLAGMRAKLLTGGVLNDAMAAAADITEGPLPAEFMQEAAAREEAASWEAEFGSDPPEEDCSGNAERGAGKVESGSSRASASRTAATGSDPLDAEAAMARRAFFGPVQADRMIAELAALLSSKQNGHAASDPAGGDTSRAEAQGSQR
jgi:hypothetical protein